MSPLGSGAVASAAIIAMLTGSTLASTFPVAVPEDDSCAFRETAVHVLAELAGDTSDRGARLRQLLIASGVATPDFVPASCRTGAATTPPSNDGNARDDASGGPGATQNGAGTGDGHCPQTAAGKLGWGTPNRESHFNGSSPDTGWSLYDGPGHAGNGRRTPDAVSVADGVLTITGSANGDAEGMAWNPGQKYGRWELCVQSPRTEAASMHSLSLLWPDDEGNSPDEVDFMEIGDPTRQKVDMFLHYQGGDQDHGELTIDATQWHAFAVDWTPDGITNYVDGRPWWHTGDTSHLPRGSMHMTIQLDYFGGAAAEAKEHVDWARQYPPGGGTTDDRDPRQSSPDQAGNSATGTGTSS